METVVSAMIKVAGFRQRKKKRALVDSGPGAAAFIVRPTVLQEVFVFRWYTKTGFSLANDSVTIKCGPVIWPWFAAPWPGPNRASSARTRHPGRKGVRTGLGGRGKDEDGTKI